MTAKPIRHATEEELAQQRESYARSLRPFRDLSDPDLLAEHAKWQAKIDAAPRWGAALATAAEFRDEATAELTRRRIKP